MEEEITPSYRLTLVDKRELYLCIMAKIDRIFFLNKFPEDINDVAMSCIDKDIAAAWMHMVENVPTVVSQTREVEIAIPLLANEIKPAKFILTAYGTIDDDIKIPSFSGREKKKYMSEVNLIQWPKLLEWGRRQIEVEVKIKLSKDTMCDLAEHCNTVGQYHRVSPELVMFLPDKYKMGLQQYMKASPHPKHLASTKEEIDKLISMLAFASLQSPHEAEETYMKHLNQRNQYSSWSPTYSLGFFPRSVIGDFGRVDPF